MNNKVFLTIIGIILTMFAIYKFDSSKISESFLPSLGIKASPSVVTPTGNVAIPNMPMPNSPLLSQLQNDQFINRPNFQNMLSPRINPNGYGAYINYKTPSRNNLAVPKNPLDYGRMVDDSSSDVKEGYCSSCSSSKQSCIHGKDKNNTPDAPSLAGNYVEEMNKAYKEHGLGDDVVLDSSIPIGNMKSVNAEGIESNVFTVNDIMYTAGKMSRTSKDRDWLRGDLAIPSVGIISKPAAASDPNSIQTGAMFVLGGINNETTKETSALKNIYSGNTQSTFSGINVGNKFEVGISNVRDGGDVTVSSFM